MAVFPQNQQQQGRSDEGHSLNHYFAINHKMDDQIPVQPEIKVEEQPTDVSITAQLAQVALARFPPANSTNGGAPQVRQFGPYTIPPDPCPPPPPPVSTAQQPYYYPQPAYYYPQTAYPTIPPQPTYSPSPSSSQSSPSPENSPPPPEYGPHLFPQYPTQHTTQQPLQYTPPSTPQHPSKAPSQEPSQAPTQAPQAPIHHDSQPTAKSSPPTLTARASEFLQHISATYPRAVELAAQHRDPTTGKPYRWFTAVEIDQIVGNLGLREVLMQRIGPEAYLNLIVVAGTPPDGWYDEQGRLKRDGK
ncbi:hypothetical protein BJ508DRAFT_364038 [Ascobolus immersus RN42]|uniref:Uncharacterized protein n=1 Tax=Ascobolus immersus RN42 TaxID=1160509 RepID=A0A3N4HXZ9_ASCIM|nr:hypothetical protein BJ508DRAFT_364038 [Ascobolus immersus RN42]